jgi:hypothetical protein
MEVILCGQSRPSAPACGPRGQGGHGARQRLGKLILSQGRCEVAAAAAAASSIPDGAAGGEGLESLPLDLAGPTSHRLMGAKCITQSRWDRFRLTESLQCCTFNRPQQTG